MKACGLYSTHSMRLQAKNMHTQNMCWCVCVVEKWISIELTNVSWKLCWRCVCGWKSVCQFYACIISYWSVFVLVFAVPPTSTLPDNMKWDEIGMHFKFMKPIHSTKSYIMHELHQTISYSSNHIKNHPHTHTHSIGMSKESTVSFPSISCSRYSTK